jgi:hypothetical protein
LWVCRLLYYKTEKLSSEKCKNWNCIAVAGKFVHMGVKGNMTEREEEKKNENGIFVFAAVKA